RDPIYSEAVNQGGEAMPSGPGIFVTDMRGGMLRRLGGQSPGVQKVLWNASSTHLVAQGEGLLWQGDVTAGTLTRVSSAVSAREIVRGPNPMTYWSPDSGTS